MQVEATAVRGISAHAVTWHVVTRMLRGVGRVADAVQVLAVVGGWAGAAVQFGGVGMMAGAAVVFVIGWAMRLSGQQ